MKLTEAKRNCVQLCTCAKEQVKRAYFTRPTRTVWFCHINDERSQRGLQRGFLWECTLVLFLNFLTQVLFVKAFPHEETPLEETPPLNSNECEWPDFRTTKKATQWTWMKMKIYNGKDDMSYTHFTPLPPPTQHTLLSRKNALPQEKHLCGQLLKGNVNSEH